MKKIFWYLQWRLNGSQEKECFARATANFLKYHTTVQPADGQAKTLDEAIDYLRSECCENDKTKWMLDKILPAALKLV